MSETLGNLSSRYEIYDIIFYNLTMMLQKNALRSKNCMHFLQ